MSATPARQKARSSRLGKSAAVAQRNRQPVKSLQRKTLTPTPAIPSSLIQLKAAPSSLEKKKKIQRQTAGKLDEKIQKKDVLPEKKKPVQLKSAVPVGPANDALEKEADQVAQRVVQMKSASTIEQKKEPIAQTKSQTGNSPAQTDLSGLEEAGSPLHDSIQRNMEQHLGTDFSDVKVHDDEAAQLKSSELGARAFTHGSNIYLGPGESQSDTGLMAHELTHVVQQRGGVAGLTTQRAKKTTPKKAKPKPLLLREAEPLAQKLPEKTGKLSEDKKTIVFRNIGIPTFKLSKHRKQLYAAHQPLCRTKNFTRGDTGQRNIWQEKLDKKSIKTKIQEIIKKSGQPVDDTQGYILEKKTPKRLFIGTIPQLSRALTLPSWSSQGRKASYHVDHIVELQLAGWPNSWANTTQNMELLDPKLNLPSGSYIQGQITKRTKDFRQAFKNQASKKYPDRDPEFPRDPTIIKKKYNLSFNKAKYGKKQKAGASQFWQKQDIESGKHLRGLNAVNASALGGKGSIYVGLGKLSGATKKFQWNDNETKLIPTRRHERFLWPFLIKRKKFNTKDESSKNQPQLGTLTANVLSKKQFKPFSQDVELTIQRISGARYAGFISDDEINKKLLSKLQKTGLSPVKILSSGYLPGVGVTAYGQILPNIPLLKGTSIDFELEGDSLRFSKTFNTGELPIPAPFKVTSSSLTVFMSTKADFGLEGDLDFEIKNAGSGSVKGSISRKNGLALNGSFDFDSKLFTQAQMSVAYKKNQWSAVGTLGIGPGKLPGLKSATLAVGYSKEKGLTAAGEGELTVPGVKKGEFQLQLAPNGDFTLGAGLTLADSIPRVSNGSIKVVVSKKGGAWAVMGSGSADIALPGVNTKLKILYDKGLFDLSAHATYKRGLLEGKLLVGVTNRQIDPATGKPTALQTENIVIYGGGGLTLQLAPWLKAGATVLLLPDGSVQVTGEIGIPKALNLFDVKKYAPDKPLFKVGIDIPIVGVSFLGKRIGIFANVSGGLEAAASIGPGQLTDLGLTVTYNPDREQDTKVTGKAKLNVPAYAGLTLFISGSIGAGLLIVSAQGGLKARGTLGVAGALNAGVDVDWTPQKGLIIDAVASVVAQPKLKISLSAFVSVEADVWLGTIDLYDNEWELAAKEFGSDLKVGVSFPVHYEEGKKFNIGLDDVKFTYPKINVMDTVKGLID